MNQEEALRRLEAAVKGLPEGIFSDDYRKMLDWQWIVLAIGGEKRLLQLARKWATFDRDWRATANVEPPVEIVRGWLTGAIGEFLDFGLTRGKAKGILIMKPQRKTKEGIDGIIEKG